MATMTEITESAVLVGRTLDGRPGRWEVKGDQLIELPGSALITQRVRTTDNTTLVCRSLSTEHDDAKRRLLDNEIRALARLTKAFPASHSFPALVGYDMDSRDPWVLVAEYRGRPASEVVSGLLRDDLEQLAVNLFRAVAHLGLVEVAHNWLSTGSVYLARASLQIVSFEHAAFFGEPKDGGSGTALPCGDILAAGKILYEAFTGARPLTDRPDLSDVSWLSSRLADVFAEPRGRPSAIDVMRRLGIADVPKVEVQDEMSAGRTAFDEARNRKLPPQPETIRIKPVAPPRTTLKSSAGKNVLLIAGLLLVVAAVILFIVVRPS
jgi:hypothetical protein